MRAAKSLLLLRPRRLCCNLCREDGLISSRNLSSAIFSTRDSDRTSESYRDFCEKQLGLLSQISTSCDGALTDSLLQTALDQYGSEPKSLAPLFFWAKKNPGLLPSSRLFGNLIRLFADARLFDCAWALLLEYSKSAEGRGLVSVDAFTILVRHYCRADMPQDAIRTYEYACEFDAVRHSDPESDLLDNLFRSLCDGRHFEIASDYLKGKRERNPGWIPGIRVFNKLLSGWLLCGKIESVETLWLHIRAMNLHPTVWTYAALVKGFCRIGNVTRAVQLLDEMREDGIEPNPVVYNPMIAVLGGNGHLKEAMGMLERLMVSASGPSPSTYDSLVKGFCGAGDLDGASRVLKMMAGGGLFPTCRTYNYFFLYFSKNGKIEEAVSLYRKLVAAGHVPDCRAYNLLIRLFCDGDRLDLVVKFRKEMIEKNGDLDSRTTTAFICLLCRLHRLKEAFVELKNAVGRGIVPSCTTVQSLSDELKKARMDVLVGKLYRLVNALARNGMIPANSLGRCPEKKRLVIQKAKAISAILGTSRNPTRLSHRRAFHAK